MEDKDTKETVNKKKIWLGYLAFFFVVFHVIAILISTFPENYTSKSVKQISKVYTEPLFAHNWGMFAPCPLTEHTLKFKLYFDDDTTELITPSVNNFNYHTKLRFTHHGDLATGEYNMLYWIKVDLDDLNISPNKKILQSQLDLFEYTRGYYLLKTYLTGYARDLKGKYPTKADVSLEYYHVKDKEKLIYHFPIIK